MMTLLGVLLIVSSVVGLLGVCVHGYAGKIQVMCYSPIRYSCHHISCLLLTSAHNNCHKVCSLTFVECLFHHRSILLHLDSNLIHVWSSQRILQAVVIDIPNPTPNYQRIWWFHELVTDGIRDARSTSKLGSMPLMSKLSKWFTWIGLPSRLTLASLFYFRAACTKTLTSTCICKCSVPSWKYTCE